MVEQFFINVIGPNTGVAFLMIIGINLVVASVCFWFKIFGIDDNN